MPRIDPLKLLVCLSVLLAPNGGIRSANEVKRLANLMAKFSKKLVSKCIYIQILKCTETELLGQFMAAGGWSLVHMWLADGITTKNWPLIQELLELLLCCPVDVERLKSNTAPKLVKSLSKDSSHEGVRLLASKLVEQWLKIARSDIRSGPLVPSSSGAQQNAEGKQNAAGSGTDSANHEDLIEDGQEDDADENVVEEECDVPNAVPIDAQQQQGELNGTDGKAETDDSEENVEEAKKAFNSAVAESNAKKAPLLFKITVKNGKQVLAKVESPTKKNAVTDDEDDKAQSSSEVAENCEKENVSEEVNAEKKTEGLEETDSGETADKNDGIKTKDDKSEKGESDKKDRRKSDERERSKDKEKSSSKDKDKYKEKDKDRKSSSSNSSSHKSSSSKSSSSKHNSSTSSSSGKSKSSTSSSSKSSSSSSSSKDKDKDRHNSSSSSNSSKSKHHHKGSSSSSSSKSSSSSSKSGSSNEKHRDHKDKSNHSSKDKDKEATSKASSPSAKLPKIPRKSRDEDLEKNDSSANNKLSPVSSKKASISIEVRNAENRPKTVKTYNSQFRSHGLIEEAPPPPSRKDLKKPASTSSPSTGIGSTATGTIASKRSSPPPSVKDTPPEKKARADPADRPGAIKLIPPKRQHSLVESDMFMDALSATLKKDVKKRKRKLSASDSSNKATGSEKPGTAAASPTATEKPANVATSPDKTTTTPSSPPRSASPPTEKQSSPSTTKTPVTASAADAATPVEAAGSEPTSPAKVVAAPMSFYRDTLADSEENNEDKKEPQNEVDQKPSEASATDADATTEEITDATAEPEEDEEDLIKKPKRIKSELNIDDEDADDKLINAVDHDLEKKMAQAEGASLEPQEVKKQPGPGCGPDGPPGVLVIHRRKGPKKQLKWKTQEELEEIRYFELDVTERCNVTKTFTDLKHLERVDEREKYMLARKIHSDDVMIERTPWLPLITVDNVPPHPDGVNSQERRIQRDRERNVLQALYFNRHMIPDSPAEPDVDVYSVSTPAHIPLEDVTGNPDSVNDFTTMPWPEPKSTPPHESAGFNSPFFPGSNNDFPPFGGTGNWDLPGANPSSMPGMLPPGRMPAGIPPIPIGGHSNNQMGAPNMMRQMSVPPSMPPNVPPNMPPAGLPHPNMFPNNPSMFQNNRGPPPSPRMMDMDDDNFRNGPPPPPNWFNNGSRGPPGNFHHNHNRGGGGGGGGGGGFGGGRPNQGNWVNNNRDNDRGGPRGSNYRPPWLQNRGNHNKQRGRW